MVFTATDNMILGLRAMACKGWRWMPGMQGLWRTEVRTLSGMKPYWVNVRVDDQGFCSWMGKGGAHPNLGDPATLGCLLQLVREAWGDACISANAMDPTRWMVEMDHGDFVDGSGEAVFNSEAEALVAALEAAPGREG